MDTKNGAVRKRSQFQNPQTGLWVIRDTNTSQFMDKEWTKKQLKESGKKRNSSEKVSETAAQITLAYIFFLLNYV